MIHLTIRTIVAVIKGVAYIVGAILFGALPLLVVALWKILKGGVKVTMWIIGTALAIVALMWRGA